MFTGYPTYDPNRALYLHPDVTKRFRGEDVYSLQAACLSVGADPRGLDGAYGPATDKAVRAMQATVGTYADGRVGPITWSKLTDHIAEPIRKWHGVAVGLPKGQLAHESGPRGGMFSRPQRKDGSFDAGVAQRNSALAQNPLKDSFNMVLSITKLCRDVRAAYVYYEGVKDVRRRWALAGGSWNAPAFTAWIAWEEGATQISRANRALPSAESRQKIEDYMDSITAYLQV